MDEQNQIIERLNQAASDPDVAKIYANGFINAIGHGDIVLLLTQNDKSVALLNMSYTVAKTLVLKLARAITELETKTGNSIMTTDEVNEKMTHLSLGEKGIKNENS